jgi:hypothetical protein
MDLNPRPYLLEVDGKKVEADIIYDNGHAAGVRGFGKEAMPLIQLVLIKQALEMPAGMKWSRHTPAGTTMARRWLGLKGNKASLLKQVEAIIDKINNERLEYIQEHGHPETDSHTGGA